MGEIMIEPSAVTATHCESTTTAQRLLGETLVSLAQVARRFPSRRRPGAVTPSAVWRWVHEGISGPGGQLVYLEAVMLSGRWLTSVEALARFAAAQQPREPASQ
jgi:hypothetical protein